MDEIDTAFVWPKGGLTSVCHWRIDDLSERVVLWPRSLLLEMLPLLGMCVFLCLFGWFMYEQSGRVVDGFLLLWFIGIPAITIVSCILAYHDHRIAPRLIYDRSADTISLPNQGFSCPKSSVIGWQLVEQTDASEGRDRVQIMLVTRGGDGRTARQLLFPGVGRTMLARLLRLAAELQSNTGIGLVSYVRDGQRQPLDSLTN